MRILLISTLLNFLVTIATPAQVKNFVIFGQQIPPGTQKSILVPVLTPHDSTVIPVTIFHGVKKGPTLGITAGVHGLEYAPILAAQALAQELNPASMSGTVLLVHLANVPGFLNRTLTQNPYDQKNLNRVFPGKMDGTSTERMAWIISNEIIARCTHFLDMHAGDANNDLRPYAGYYNYFSQPKVSETARQMAVALGYDFIVQFGNQAKVPTQSIYCSREATLRNIPAIDIECGRMGIVEEKLIRQIQAAVKNLLRHLHIIEGHPTAVKNPIMVAQRTDVESPQTGFFYSDLTSGDYVKKGMHLGYITDLFGKKLTDITCPVDGVILYKTFNPPIKKGEGLFNIGHIQ